MADIFISYSRRDAARVRTFADAFAAAGLDVWWDDAIRAGDAYDEAIEEALHAARAVVVLWSPHSVRSRWVRAEAAIGDRARALVPVAIAPCERPIMFELSQTAELTGWDGDTDDPAWQDLLADVRRLTDGARAPVRDHAPAAPRPAPTAVRTGTRGGAPTLAVLPFANRSGVAADEVFAEGMVEDVIAALSQGVNVAVLSSMVTAGLRGQPIPDLAALGERLGVRYLLEGNVRRAGDTLRATAQILEPASGKVLWSGRFDRPLRELGALQEDLVTELAASLDVQVQGLELQRILKKPQDLTAWEELMRSNAAYHRLDAASLTLALRHARRATEIAPDYAAAHAQVALASAVMYLLGSPDDAAEEARIAALVDRALALEPDDALVLVAAGCALNYVGRPADALRLLTRAIGKVPGHGMAHYHLGVSNCLLDRHAAALHHLDAAIRLFAGSPLLYLTIAWRAGALLRAGTWDEAEAAFDAALALNPDFLVGRVQKAVCRARAGDAAAAQTLLAPLRTLPGYDPRQTRTILRRILGDGSAGREMVAGADRLWNDMPHPAAVPGVVA